MNILKMNNSVNSTINRYKYTLKEYTSKLKALSPLEILKRGYSITRTIPDKLIITDAKNVNIDQMLEVMVSKGNIICRVERIK
jgi:exodeoxyribonuclease VII large subunit